MNAIFLCCLLQLISAINFANNSNVSESENPNYLIGQQFFLKGDFDKATKHFKRSLTFDPNHAASHYAIAKIHFLSKDSVKAFEYFRNTLSLQKDFRDASALFNQTLEVIRANYDPNSKNPRQLSAQIYLDFKSGRTGSAKRQIDWLVKSHPDFAMGWDHLANYFYRLKDLNQSLNYLKKALSLEPTNPTIFKHYESTYYLKNHEILPKKDLTLSMQKRSSDQSSDNALIDRFIANEMTRNDSLKSTEIDIRNSPEREDTIQTSSANDSKFFNKLLSKEGKLIPSKTEQSKKSAEKSNVEPKPVYEPLPEIKRDRNIEKIDLINRALEAYNNKNWVIAATSYGILSENNPQDKLFSKRFEESKKFDKFERKFRKARVLLQRAKKNPSIFNEAKEEFRKLDTRIYYKLYQKSSFDNYLASIAFTQREFKEAETLFRSWLRHEPNDLDSHYYLLLCLDALKKYDASYKVYLSAMKIDSEKLLQLKGVNKIRLKLYLFRYWWILLIFLVAWGLLTAAYAGNKLIKRREHSDRKNRLQNVRNLGADRNWLEMIRAIDKLLLDSTSESENYNLQYMRANALYQLSKLIDAERQINALLSKNPDDQQALTLKARIFLDQNKTDLEALKPYRLLTIKDPTNLELMKVLLQTLKKQNIFTAETESVALRILDIESYNKDTLKDLTEIYVKSETYNSKSCEIMRRYLEIYTGESLVLLHYVKALVRTENYIEAIRNGKKLIDINPDIEEAHRLLIEAYDYLNMRDEMNSYYHSLSLEFSSSKIVQQMYNMIQTTYKSSGIDRNELDDNQEMEITEVAFREGLNLLEKKAYKDAMLKFQTAATDDRFALRSQILCTKASLNLDDFESACFYLKKLNLQEHKLDEEALDTLYSMAECYCKDDNNVQALQLFQLIAKNDVSFKDVVQKIELLSSNS